MLLMVCECSPYLQALEGLRHVLREILLRDVPFEQVDEERKKIDIVGLQPVYDEYSFENKLRYMNSGRRFIRHIRKFSRLVGARYFKIDWNLFMFRDVRGNKIMVGCLPSNWAIVVAFQGPAEQDFIGMMEERRPDFLDINEVLVEDAYLGDEYASKRRKMLADIRNLMAS